MLIKLTRSRALQGEEPNIWINTDHIYCVYRSKYFDPTARKHIWYTTVELPQPQGEDHVANYELVVTETPEDIADAINK